MGRLSESPLGQRVYYRIDEFIPGERLENNGIKSRARIFGIQARPSGCRHREDRYPGCQRIALEYRKCIAPAHSRQIDIHENDVWLRGPGEINSGFGSSGYHEMPVIHCLENRSHQVLIPEIILDVENRPFSYLLSLRLRFCSRVVVA